LQVMQRKTGSLPEGEFEWGEAFCPIFH
jgi:hypothetical protein